MTTYDDRLRDALRAQHREWFDYKQKSIKPEFAEFLPCPVCGSHHYSPYMEKDYFTFSRCDDCSMVFLNPRLNVEATYAFYNGEWTAIYNENKFKGVSESTEADNNINQGNIELLRRYLGAPIEKKLSLLEIGIGSGYFLSAAEDAGFSVRGVDVDASNVERVHSRFGSQVQNCDLYDADYHNATFDVVYMRDVFEHVPNPSAMLKEINRISKIDALVYIEVPNMEGLIYRFVGARHVCVFGFAHLNYWSPSSLREVLKINGYEVVDIVHESLDCTLAEIVRYLRKPSFTSVFPTQAGMFSYLLLTVIYAFLRLPPVAWLDRKLLPAVANSLKMGSVIKVVARKVTNF